MNKILYLIPMLIYPLLHSTAVTANPEKTVICKDESSYIKRRLGQTESDNICQRFSNKVMLIVNTASRCAYTDQYDGLEKLYSKYKEKGLVVIGFPSNDFGHQEPGNEKSIKEFCRLTYGVKFPMYEKTAVIGSSADPLFKTLAKASGETPRWNFHKYLIDKNGRLIGSYNSAVTPENQKLISTIKQALSE